MADLNDYTQLFAGLKTKDDYDRADQEFQLKRQLAQAEVMKAQQLDIDKIGEQAFYKAAQGVPLTPQELAAAKVVDAKSGGIQFDPVTGAMIQKPRLSDKIGLPGMTPAVTPATANPNDVTTFAGDVPAGSIPQEPSSGMPALPTVPGTNQGVAVAPASDFDRNYQTQMNAARGNPKLQQQIQQSYATEKLKYNSDQSNSAGFSDRMINDEGILQNPDVQAAALSRVQNGLADIPVVGNSLVSANYQKFDQAQRDFINAQLRRESGAAISTGEFDNAYKQYLPVPGDGPDVLAQKQKARATVLQAMQRGAGPGYQPKSPLYTQSQTAFDAKKTANTVVPYTDFFKVNN